MLNMEDFADAVVGVPGEGLNVEQRKLLTIGVELAARPKLLLFLDEPTSGLDSQSSWAICAFLRKLADSGQAVLCTIHQPSAILFQTFDRLLFLAKGGKTVYFGDIGHNSRTLLDYFERNGARACGDQENPAEFMLEVVNHGTNDRGENWFDVWKNSPEQQAVNAEIDHIHEQQRNREPNSSAETHAEFAMPLTTQIAVATHRSFQQYWRTPSYVFAKFLLGVAAGLFIGFTFFDVKTSQAGTQNAIFAVFLLTTIFTTIVQQVSRYITSFRVPVANASRSNLSSSLSVIYTKFESGPAKHIRGRHSCWPTSSSKSHTKSSRALLFLPASTIPLSAFNPPSSKASSSCSRSSSSFTPRPLRT